MKPRFGYRGFIHFDVEGTKPLKLRQVTGYHVVLRRPGIIGLDVPGEIIKLKGGSWTVHEEDTIHFFSKRAEAAMFLYNNLVADKL